MQFETVIGLEIHVQLLTESKIFSPASAKYGGAQNTHVEPITLGMPGVLPVLNKKVVEYAIRVGLATQCTIAQHSIFARKHYFYPDLPKGYQISQYEAPICENGFVDIKCDNNTEKRIRLNRIHLEEDAGKSIHAESFVGANETLIDLNRCGVPLIEIVSEPDLSTPHEAALYLEKIRQIVRYLKVSDGNMDEGSLRCDANVSIRPEGATELGIKTELKNMNSISGVEKALEYEINRQQKLVRAGEKIIQQTLLWDAGKNMALPMRSKEDAHDYRYFPDPDLPPVFVGDEWRQEIADSLPELPDAKRERFIIDFKIPSYAAGVLTAEADVATYFEHVARKCGDAKLASNWVMGEVLRIVKNEKINIADFSIIPARLAELIQLIKKGTISLSAGKRVFNEMLSSTKEPARIIEEMELSQISDTAAVEKMIDGVLAGLETEIEKYRSGNRKLIGFFVGQIMRASKGKANPQLVNKILQQKLGSESKDEN